MLQYLVQIMFISIVFFVFTVLNTTGSTNKLPLWSWECENDKCVPKKPTMSTKLQSLMTCNMLCASMNIWPHPTGYVTLSTNAIPVRANSFIPEIISSPSKSVNDCLYEAFELFVMDLRRLESKTRNVGNFGPVIVKVAISENGSVDPRMLVGTDETFQLSLEPAPKNKTMIVNISANSFCGARHALATLSQLIWYDPEASTLLMMEGATVIDAPRFRYRGLLLDTVHHFFHVDDILRTISAMAYCKLNTFHWYITALQAFSDSVPHLVQRRSEAMYTSDDIRTVARHARLRGIRVLLEIDLPEYTGINWSGPPMGFDPPFCIENDSVTSVCLKPPCGQMYPLNPQFYNILQNIYAEIIQLTGVNDIFHLGGNRIPSQCLIQNKNSSLEDIWLDYIRKALQALEVGNGQLPNLTVFWASNMNDRIKIDLQDYVQNVGLQTRDVDWAQKYVSGVRTVISHENVWDLNSGLGAWYEESNGAPYSSWQQVYGHRPWAHSGVGCIEGGEATVWSWTLDGGGLDATVWPRAAALAERLWSDRGEGASRSVHARLDVHCARLISNGIQPTPLWSMWCSQNPLTC